MFPLPFFAELFREVVFEPDLAFVFFAWAEERSAAQGTWGKEGPEAAFCALPTASLAMASTIQRK